MGVNQNGWKYKKEITIYKAVQLLTEELSRMGAKSITITSNLKLKKDGQPVSNQREPDDKGVAAIFIRGDKTFTVAIDRYSRIADNIKAISRTINAYRQIERDGGPEVFESAMYGFTRGLPAPGETTNSVGRDPWAIMGLDRISLDEKVLKSRWRELSKKYHTDNKVTGNPQEFNLVQWAYGQLKQNLEKS